MKFGETENPYIRPQKLRTYEASRDLFRFIVDLYWPFLFMLFVPSLISDLHRHNAVYHHCFIIKQYVF